MCEQTVVIDGVRFVKPIAVMRSGATLLSAKVTMRDSSVRDITEYAEGFGGLNSHDYLANGIPIELPTIRQLIPSDIQIHNVHSVDIVVETPAGTKFITAHAHNDPAFNASIDISPQ